MSIRDLIAQRPYDNAAWVATLRASLGTAPAWRAVVVAALPAELNGGNHHAYVDVIDEAGAVIQNPDWLTVSWDWAGRTDDQAHDPKPFDKPAPEAGANLPLWPGQMVALRILDKRGLASDVVTGLSSEIGTPSPDGLNRPGHYSYYLVFQRITGQGMPPVVPVPLTLESLDKRLSLVEGLVGVKR